MRPLKFSVRALMIAVAVVGAAGGTAGAVAGLTAPNVITFLYTLEGPDAPASFSPVVWGARQGFIVGITLGAAGWVFACLVARFSSWRPRMTTRRWMVAVAVAGASLGAWTWIERRRTEFIERAAAHRRWVIVGCRVVPRWALRKSDYHEALAGKYRAAARHPWLPVPPDPPEPE